MKKILLGMCFLVSACAQDPYRLKINNSLSEAHGQSVYFRSSLRSAYAGQIRRVISGKFAEMGIKAAASAETADYIAVFDIETLYKQREAYKNTSYANVSRNAVLFTADENAESLYYSGNANIKVDKDKTCFTINIGKKETSKVDYFSSFCAETTMETEDFLPLVLDIYGKYASFQNADVGVQCLNDTAGNISCQPVHDRQQAFIDSLWREHDIKDD